LYNNPAEREQLKHYQTISSKNKVYQEWTEQDLCIMQLANYFTQGDYAGYMIPILGDAMSAEFIRNKRFKGSGYDTEIINRLLETTFMYELNRIQLVRDRQKLPDTEKIENFDKRGGKFVYFPFLNDHLEEILEKYKADDPRFDDYMKGLFSTHLEKVSEDNYNHLVKIGVIVNDAIPEFGIDKGFAREKIREFTYNNYYATANIIAMTVIDPAYMKDAVDFQKRYKQVHSSGTKPYTKAKYKSEDVGREKERYVVISDVKQKTEKKLLDAIVGIIDGYKHLTDDEKARIKANYGWSNHEENGKKYAKSKTGSVMYPVKEHNLTDGQAYRFLESFRRLMVMTDQWNDALEDSYKRLNSKKWKMKDWEFIQQAVKGFVYSQTEQGYTNPVTGENVRIKMPTQHKYSETILMPMTGEQFNSPELNAFNELFNRNDLDLVVFESSVKVGKTKVVDARDIASPEPALEKVTPDRIQEIPYEDYMIQNTVPEHLQDTDISLSSQMMTELFSDIDERGTYEIGAMKMTGEEVKNTWFRIVNNHLDKKLSELTELFGNIENVQSLVIDHIKNSDRYPQDLLNYIRIENGKFRIPLYDPSIMNNVMELFNSVWAKRLDYKMHGGWAVNVSSYGLSDDLKLHIDNNNVLYLDCYLPWWSNALTKDMRTMLKKNKGILDVKKLVEDGIIDPELLEGIAYRTPTENKYSAIIFRVKGFLPRGSGGNIVLPKEITTLTGLDFDIDKMAILLKEFRKTPAEYDREQAWKDFADSYDYEIKALRKEVEDMGLSREEFADALENLMIERGLNDAFEEWIEDNSDDYYISGSERFETIDWDHLTPSPSPKERGEIQSSTPLPLPLSTREGSSMSNLVDNLTSEEENNLVIDLYKGVWKNSNTAANILNGGSFENLRDIVNIIVELEGVQEQSEDLLDAMTQTGFQQQNITGKNMIGIYANAKSNHGIRNLIKSDITVNPIEEKGGDLGEGKSWRPAISLNGKNYTKLNNMFNEKGLISRLYTNFLSAVVDSVKDPLLRTINCTMATADSYATLIGLGYDIETIALFMNHPALKELSLQVNKPFDLKKKIDERLKKAPGTFRYSQALITNANLKKAIKNREINDDLAYSVLQQMSDIINVSKELTDFTLISKAYAKSGRARGNFSKLLQKSNNIRKFNAKKTPLINGLRIYNFNDGSDRHEHETGFIHNYIYAGIVQNMDTMRKWFPFLNANYEMLISEFQKLYGDDALSAHYINRFIMSYMFYVMNGSNEFRFDYNFLRDFPRRYEDFFAGHANLKGTYLYMNLYTMGIDRELSKIRLRSMDSMDKERITMEWDSLVRNPETRNFALDLFKYSVMAYGFKFGDGSFFDLAPSSVKTESLTYLHQLQSVNTAPVKTNEPDIEDFMQQFFINNYKSNGFTVEVETDQNADLVVVTPDSKDISEIKLYKFIHPKTKKLTYYQFIVIRSGKVLLKKLNLNEKLVDNFPVYGNFELLGDFMREKIKAQAEAEAKREGWKLKQETKAEEEIEDVDYEDVTWQGRVLEAGRDDSNDGDGVQDNIRKSGADMEYEEDRERFETDDSEVQGSGFNVQDSKFKVQGSIFPKRNLFSVKPKQSNDSKAKAKASIATQYIGFGEGLPNSSTQMYANQIAKQNPGLVNSGKYGVKDVVFVSVPGKRGDKKIRKEQQDKTIKLALDAIKAGATLITDSQEYIKYNPENDTYEEDYNTGEQRLAKNLRHAGYSYSEVVVDGNKLGVWKGKGERLRQEAEAKGERREVDDVEKQSISRILKPVSRRVFNRFLDLLKRSGLARNIILDKAAMIKRLAEGGSLEQNRVSEIRKKYTMPRTAKSVSEAQRLIRPLVNKPLTNKTLGITATISGKSISKFGSSEATGKSINPRLHAKAIVNIDKLFTNAEIDIVQNDSKKRKEVEKVHRIGTLMFDEQTNIYVPVLITAIEYLKDGNRIYSVEAIDLIKKENSAGLITASDLNAVRQVPSTEFSDKRLAGQPTRFQDEREVSITSLDSAGQPTDDIKNPQVPITEFSAKIQQLLD
jgi:hypothetical protein